MSRLPDAHLAHPLAADDLAFERMLAELSRRFLILPTAKVDGAITDALRQIVELIGVDRSQLIRFSSSDNTVRVTHSWAVEGVQAVSLISLADRYPWLMGRIRAGETVVIPRVENLPQEAGVDQASFRSAGTRANLTVPLLVAGRVEGCLAFGCLRHAREWQEGLIVRIRILAEVFANALAHKRTREELEAAIDFEHKTSAILRALLVAPWAEQDTVLQAGLGEVARAFGADRATLWQRVEADGLFRKTHRWLADGIAAPPEALRMPRLPWISGQLARGVPVCFARHAELPPEARGDLEALRDLRIGAEVIVPLAQSGAVTGALSIAREQEVPAWPHELVTRVQFIGEAFASSFARREAERREQNAQAQAAHAARVGTMGVFAASLVHELTQPLAASLSNAETAAGLIDAMGPEMGDLRATVSDIVSDSRRAGEMIQKLRRFLRHGEAERNEFDLAALLAEVLSFVKAEANHKDVEIAVDVAAALPRIVGDRVQIQQVLINLLLNAFDAVSTCDANARRVMLSARATDDGVAVEVADSGVGMDGSTLAHIFQPFFTTKATGMGLGLSISQTIVATHGGTLSVRSQPGAGSVFRIELPLQQPLVIGLTPLTTPTATTGDTVFLIDDDDAVRRAIKRQLQGAGFRVQGFNSARAFIDTAPEADCACIVSDVCMPGMSGLDLQTTLAQENVGWPIVFVSGYLDIPTTVQAMRAGAAAFLTKPFAKVDLLAAVADALATSRKAMGGRRHDAEILRRHASLTRRECEVFDLVVAGLLNKVVADRMGIAETTVKIHRGRVMEKMGARSAAELVPMAQCVASQAATRA